MKVYQEEIQAFDEYKGQKPWEDLLITKEQYNEVMKRGRPLLKWTQDHPYLHNTINAFLVFALIASDILLLMGVNHFYPQYPVLSVLAGILVHGFLNYSVIIFTIHEGGAHDRIITDKGPISRFMAILANNASRIYMGDPVYYKEGHILHHKYFGTEKDGSFTNYIDPSRFWKSLIPAASFLDFNDFRVHVGTKMSRSKLLTLVLTGLFKTFILFYILSSLPLLAKGIFLIVSTWLAFTLDRVRESFEHNLMPDDNSVASRSLGLSFWGIVLGGGPWGQPCHYMHHLFASLPWYSQVIMHYEVQDIYTEKQKQEIFTSDFFYVPKKFFELLKENRKLMNKVKNVNESEEQSTEVISLIELPMH